MTTYAWHFLRDNERLNFLHNGENTLIRPGMKLTVDPPLRLCVRGLHASVRPLDALRYAHGTVICRVTCSGKIIHGNDKLVCQHRHVIWMANIERELFEFGCWGAEQILKRKNVTDKRYWDVIKTKRAWLDGNATDKELLTVAYIAKDFGSDYGKVWGIFDCTESIHPLISVKNLVWHQPVGANAKLERILGAIK